MKRRKGIVYLLIVAGILILSQSVVYTNIVQPRPGLAGNPPDLGTCYAPYCHHIGSQIFPVVEDTILFEIGQASNYYPVRNFTYQPNTAYVVHFDLRNIRNGTTNRYGFEMIALDTNNKQAGLFSLIDTTVNSLPVSDSGLVYIGHKNASHNTKSWTFNWQAPATAAGDIVFYYTINAANGDSTPTGDYIYYGTDTIHSSISSGLVPLTEFMGLNLPSLVSGDIHLPLTFRTNAKVNIDLYSTDGKLLKNLMQEKVASGSVYEIYLPLNAYPSGIYFISISINDKEYVRKVTLMR